MSEMITSEDLTVAPKRYVVATSLSDMEGMVGVKPAPGSVYILSSSEPYNEEMELDMQRLIEWLDFYGMQIYHIHVSGNIMPQQLRSLDSSRASCCVTSQPAIWIGPQRRTWPRCCSTCTTVNRRFSWSSPIAPRWPRECRFDSSSSIGGYTDRRSKVG